MGSVCGDIGQRERASNYGWSQVLGPADGDDGGGKQGRWQTNSMGRGHGYPSPPSPKEQSNITASTITTTRSTSPFPTEKIVARGKVGRGDRGGGPSCDVGSVGFAVPHRRCRGAARTPSPAARGSRVPLQLQLQPRTI
ncbi:hypothetical protein VOLCADRAFT_108133, partial [Volvox carteri f. nagariensis]